MTLQLALDGEDPRDVVLVRTGHDTGTIAIQGRRHEAGLRPVGRRFELSVDDRSETVWVAVDGDFVYVHALGRHWRIEVIDPVVLAAVGGGQADVASAPMPGVVVSTSVEAGDAVAVGQVLLVIESMKMHNEIVAWRDGVVERVHFPVGESFNGGAGLVSLVSEDEE
jgi:biotin carboxyl carrier protein